MKINLQIFGPYDIRGIYPAEIDEEISYLVGRAFVNFLKKPRPKIAIGRDNRLSSPSLFKALKKGILDQGGEVIDLGLVITPILYWACGHFKFDGGVMISASHNPAQYNGFKLVREKAIPISGESGLEEIKRMVLAGRFKSEKKGKLLKKKVLAEYLQFNFKNFNLGKIKPFKIIIDTANGVAGILIPHLKNKLPCRIFSLFEKLDGSFPHHSPNPLIRENLRFLQKEIKKKKADLGIAFDGDGDRIAFLNEKGEIIPGDLITAFLAKLILREYPGEKILYDISSSNIVREVIEKAGGKAVANRVGHSLIKERMRKENILFAGEFSGHYYHKDHYFSEAPLFVLLKILERLSQTKKTFSQEIKFFQKYFHSGEINFKVKDRKEILRNLEKKFKGKGKISKVDGLRVDFRDWWFLVRPSGTEDILRLVIEAKTKKLMKEKKEEISSFILKY